MRSRDDLRRAGASRGCGWLRLGLMALRRHLAVAVAVAMMVATPALADVPGKVSNEPTFKPSAYQNSDAIGRWASPDIKRDWAQVGLGRPPIPVIDGIADDASPSSVDFTPVGGFETGSGWRWPRSDMQVMLSLLAAVLGLSLIHSMMCTLAGLTGLATARPPQGRAMPAARRGGHDANQCRLLLESATTQWRGAEAAVLDLQVGLPLRTLLLNELTLISKRLAASPAVQAAQKNAVAVNHPDLYWQQLGRDISRSIRDLKRIQAVADAGRASFGDRTNEPRMPTTIEEAYFVIGANADVDAETLQRLVRALRQCWHPDLSQTPADRSYREARIRQINVAHDIISRKKMATAL